MYVIWSPQLGAERRHVGDAAALLRDSRARHFWDPGALVGTEYRDHFDLDEAAWDVWLLFGRDAVWPAENAPEPAWWEHQLRVLSEDRRLDPERFARRAAELLRRGDPAPD